MKIFVCTYQLISLKDSSVITEGNYDYCAIHKMYCDHEYIPCKIVKKTQLNAIK
jgi:hypothetical protein